MLTVHLLIVSSFLLQVLLALRNSIYSQRRLFDICTNRTSLIFDKVVYKLDSTPTILTLNSKDVKNQPYLYCHLELHLPSDRYGVQIFIEEMKLSGSGQNCTEDFLQFGRDVLFITTHLSAKICGTIPRSGLTREEGLQLQNTSESHQLSVASFTRHYSEESDSEMDLWVFMSRPVNNAGSSEEKFLRILLTPYRKVCDPRDHFYRACHRKNSRCIRTELWCDGHMNCPTSEKHSSPDEDDCPKAEVPEQQQQQEDDDNSLVAMSLIVGLSALFTTSIIGAVVMYRSQRNDFLSATRLERKLNASSDISTTNEGSEINIVAADTGVRHQIRLGRSYQDMEYDNGML